MLKKTVAFVANTGVVVGSLALGTVMVPINPSSRVLITAGAKKAIKEISKWANN